MWTHYSPSPGIDTTSIVTTLFIHPRVVDLYASLGYIIQESCSLPSFNVPIGNR